MKTTTYITPYKEFRMRRYCAFLFRKQVERGERSGVFKAIYHWRKPKNMFQEFWWWLNAHSEADVEWIEEPVKEASRGE